MSEMKIYVACLAAYNQGFLHGKWIDLNGSKDEDDVMEEIKKIIQTSPAEGAEEWAIHDYEMPGGLKVHEYESIHQLMGIVSAIEEHGEAFIYWYKNLMDLEEAINTFEGAYVGQYESFRDYSDDVLDELYLQKVPETIKYYIDYDAFARDLEMDYMFEDGHIFRL